MRVKDKTKCCHGVGGLPESLSTMHTTSRRPRTGQLRSQPPRPVSATVGARPRDARTAHCPGETGVWPWGNTPGFIEGHPFSRSAARPPVAVSGMSHSTSWQSPGPDQTNQLNGSPRGTRRKGGQRGDGQQVHRAPTQDPLRSCRQTFAHSYAHFSDPSPGGVRTAAAVNQRVCPSEIRVFKISDAHRWQHSCIRTLVSLSTSKSTSGVTALKRTPAPWREL